MDLGNKTDSQQLLRVEELRQQVKSFPTLPGVYVMKSGKDEIIYIGKAKNLRHRVRTYFGAGDGRAQIQFLLRRINSIEFIVTGSEEQAFILERDLINKHKPRYNIRLKDDKAYLSIRLDENQKWPRLQLVRRVEQDGAKYYGPYTYSYEVRTLLDVINKTILLRTCSDTVLYNRQRPCLEHQIKRCAAPCCLHVDEGDYNQWVQEAKQVLEGKVDNLVAKLTEKMDRYSELMEFELAADVRDKLTILENFSSGQQYISPGAEHRDVFSIVREKRLVALSVMTVRYGRISDNKNYTFSDVLVSDSELLEDAVEQYYRNGREVPEEVVLPQLPAEPEFLKNQLSERRGGSVKLTAPQRGLKFRLLKLAEVNAQQHFETTFNAESRYLEVAETLARLTNLSQIPRRIECVDISNFQGSEVVGAVVSFFDGKPDKQNYKRYVISEQGKQDDFAAIYEVIHRRLLRGKKAGMLPDLIVIDGGKGQLSSAIKARDELGVSLEIISLAKERVDKKERAGFQKSSERLFVDGQSLAIDLPRDGELTKLVTRIRDEVHRFVITFHRGRRNRAGMKSILDDIQGVGPERKRRLFKQYGSIQMMSRVSTEELAKAGRMPKSLAQKVLLAIKDSEGQ